MLFDLSVKEHYPRQLLRSLAFAKGRFGVKTAVLPILSILAIYLVIIFFFKLINNEHIGT